MYRQFHKFRNAALYKVMVYPQYLLCSPFGSLSFSIQYCMLLYFENVFGLFILKIRNFLSSFHLSFVIYKFIFLLLFIVSKSYIFINKNLINNAIIQTTFHWRYESNTIKRFSLRELRFLARSTFLCNREFQQNFLLHKIMGFEKKPILSLFSNPIIKILVTVQSQPPKCYAFYTCF